MVEYPSSPFAAASQTSPNMKQVLPIAAYWTSKGANRCQS